LQNLEKKKMQVFFMTRATSIDPVSEGTAENQKGSALFQTKWRRQQTFVPKRNVGDDKPWEEATFGTGGCCNGRRQEGRATAAASPG
jgi:hypothetical protein